MTGYGLSAEAYFAAGWVPMPIPHEKKWPPPTGLTGDRGREVSFSDIYDWVEHHADSNVALRLPRTVIGIDVDGYKPRAIETMNHIASVAGQLPATWRSSSRGDDDTASGILFFRVPEGVAEHLRDPRHPTEGSKGSDVEIIRWDHRYAVVAPSLAPPAPKGSGMHYQWYAPDGTRTAPRVDQLPELPAAWIDQLRAKEEAAPQAPSEVNMAFAGGYEGRIVQGNIDRLEAMKTAATNDVHGYRGEPWDQTTYDVAARLTEVANADWSQLNHDTVQAIVLQHAPRDPGFDDARVLAKIASARRKVGASAAAGPTGGTMGSDAGMFASSAAPALPGEAPVGVRPPRVVLQNDLLDVTNLSDTVVWLRENVGVGHLAGMFYRQGGIVYTPRVGSEGYIEPRDAIAEGAASISPVTKHHLRARIQNRFNVVKTTPDRTATKAAQKANPDADTVWKNAPDVFPLEAAEIAVSAADDLTNLRELKGVVHSPTFRADGTLIDRPGYDEATGVLFLPTGGQPAPIPVHPSQQDLAIARSWIDFMLSDFRFVSADDRANYVGLMLTPLLREITPSPYKLGVIEAHQPGSGKTFLARALTSIHGGLMHSEMPTEEEDLKKVIATDLDSSTAPVIIFDNVTGFVRSSTLAGLLTNPVFSERRLGGNTRIEADNDRLWVITGNNAQLGGDLARRNVRVRIDPGVPDPEKRTRFAIANFEDWVRDHRSELLWSLLVMVRAWIVAGQPVPAEIRQDSYGRWGAAVGGILWCAGVPGVFDAVQLDAKDPETEEWEILLDAIWARFQDRTWTVKGLLTLVSSPMAGLADPSRPIPYDVLPGALAGTRGLAEPASMAKPLGKWFANREGRWAGQLTVRCVGVDSSKTKVWQLERYGS